MKKRALILLASSPGEGAVGIVEAASGSSDRTLKSGDDPVVTALWDVELYIPAAKAHRAVRQLPYERRSLRLLSSAGAMFLQAVETEPFENLAAENARSAELSLALALLMFQRQSPLSIVAATGALELPRDKSSEDRVVAPVDGLSGKFAALGDYLERHVGGEKWGEDFHLFVPTLTIDGAPILEAHAPDFERLHRSAEKAKIKLRVHPVALLSEAAKILKAVGKRRHPREALAWVGLIASAAATAAAAVFGVAAFQPTQMRFAPISLGDLGAVESPVRSEHQRALGRFTPQPECVGLDGAPHIPFSEGISLRVSTQARWTPVWAYEFLVVVAGDAKIDDAASLKLFPMAALPVDNQPHRTAEGEISWGMRLGVEPPAEEMKLFVLGRKFLPFDAAAIERNLGDLMRNAPFERRLNVALNYLDSLSGPLIEYSFHVAENLEDCVIKEDEI